MVPIGESDLVTPSLNHGCPTVVDDDVDWIKVVSNNKRSIEQEDDKYVIATSGQEARATDDMGCPLNHIKIKIYKVLSNFYMVGINKMKSIKNLQLSENQ